jgi:hypothetical protein
MRMFTSTKVLLLFALLAVNLGPAKRALAQGCPDSTCCKTCGAITQENLYQRNCSSGTCHVTLCGYRSSHGVGCTDNFVDLCGGQTWPPCELD